MESENGERALRALEVGKDEGGAAGRAPEDFITPRTMATGTSNTIDPPRGAGAAQATPLPSNCGIATPVFAMGLLRGPTKVARTAPFIAGRDSAAPAQDGEGARGRDSARGALSARPGGTSAAPPHSARSLQQPIVTPRGAADMVAGFHAAGAALLVVEEEGGEGETGTAPPPPFIRTSPLPPPSPQGGEGEVTDPSGQSPKEEEEAGPHAAPPEQQLEVLLPAAPSVADEMDDEEVKAASPPTVRMEVVGQGQEEEEEELRGEAIASPEHWQPTPATAAHTGGGAMEEDGEMGTQGEGPTAPGTLGATRKRPFRALQPSAAKAAASSTPLHITPGEAVSRVLAYAVSEEEKGGAPAPAEKEGEGAAAEAAVGALAASALAASALASVPRKRHKAITLQPRAPLPASAPAKTTAGRSSVPAHRPLPSFDDAMGGGEGVDGGVAAPAPGTREDDEAEATEAAAALHARAQAALAAQARAPKKAGLKLAPAAAPASSKAAKAPAKAPPASKAAKAAPAPAQAKAQAKARTVAEDTDSDLSD
jgi:hypothetical protein